MPEYIRTLIVDASHDQETGLVGIGIVVQQRIGKGRRGPIIEQLAECHGCELLLGVMPATVTAAAAGAPRYIWSRV